MSVKLPNGSTVSIASTYGVAKTMSALTNAAEGVATLEASHGVIVGDIIEVSSGWSKVNGVIARAKTVATNDVTLESIVTTDTSHFPAGSGIGTVREVTAWTQINQILEFNSAGGEQQFATYSFLEDDTERQIPTQKSAESFSMSLADDQSLAWYSVLATADYDRLTRAIKIVLPSGAILYYNAFVSFNKTPSLTKNNVMALKATFSINAPVTRYAS